MNSVFVDLTGKRFGHLEVLSLVQNGKTRRSWLAICDCGKKKVIGESRLFPMKGRNPDKSCGCFQLKQHGWSVEHPRIFKVWRNMLSRCFDPTADNYARYGGKGTTVCDEWKNDFGSFLQWSLNNGYRDKLTLDRINSGEPYRPSNCRWADYYTQAQNKGISSRNCTGVTGVSRSAKQNTYRAYIRRDGIQKVLGKFKNLEDAILARKRAEEYYSAHGTLEDYL